jgi:hypothetical protein
MGDGYRENGTTGWGRDIAADGGAQGIEYKFAGARLDWDTVAAVGGADVTLSDGTVIAIGQKYLDAGQVMVGITATAKAVVTLNNTPTGGTFPLTVATTLPVPGGTETTTALAYNASAATVQAAIRLLANVAPYLPTVTGSAGGPYTVTFPQELGEVMVTGNGAGLTGAGAQPTVTVATTEEGNDTGAFGPYDPAATDGRADALDARDDKGILRKPIIYNPNVLARRHDTLVGLIVGGPVKKGMIKATAGAHSLAAGPTWAELRAGFPRLVLVSAMKGSHI